MTRFDVGREGVEVIQGSVSILMDHMINLFEDAFDWNDDSFFIIFSMVENNYKFDFKREFK